MMTLTAILFFSFNCRTRFALIPEEDLLRLGCPPIDESGDSGRIVEDIEHCQVREVFGLIQVDQGVTIVRTIRWKSFIF